MEHLHYIPIGGAIRRVLLIVNLVVDPNNVLVCILWGRILKQPPYTKVIGMILLAALLDTMFANVAMKS